MPLHRLSLVVIIYVLLAIAGQPLLGQLGTGTLNGTVTDPSGAAIPNATLVLTNMGTNAARNIVASKKGYFTIPDLNIGLYRISATAPGFSTATEQGLEVTVGAQLTIDLPLAVGVGNTTVTVSTDAQSEVNSTSGEQSTLINPTQIKELPLNGRNFEQLILLAPGVQPSTGSPKTALYGRSASFSVSGSRPEGQAELLDGADIQGYWNRGSGASVVGTSLGIEGIAEFQTLTGIYGAQFGGNGSVINAVTKSGTNLLHGSVYEFVRNSKLDTRNAFDPLSGPPDFSRNQFGGSIGFPLRKDKTFGFINYEGVRQKLGQVLTSNTLNVNTRAGYLPCAPNPGNAAVCMLSSTTAAPNPALNPYLQNFGVNANVAPYISLFPLPNGADNRDGSGVLTSVQPNPANENYFQSRLDQTLSAKDNLALRYVSDNGTLTDPFPGMLVAGFPEVSVQRNRYATIEEKHVFSSKFLNTARLHFVRNGFAARQQAKDPAYSLLQFVPGAQYGDLFIASLLPSGSAQQGFGPSISAERFINSRYSVQDDAYVSLGSHQLQIGIDVDADVVNGRIGLFEGGQYTFPNLSSFLTSTPAAVVYGAPGSNSERNPRQIEASPYVQDDWKVSAHLTVNVGLRYLFATNPIEANGKNVVLPNPLTDPAFISVEHPFGHNPSTKNFDPRVGFAFAPGSGKTALRGGFGIYHNLIEARTYNSGQNTTGLYSLKVVAGAGVPFPNPLVGNAGAPIASNQPYYNNTRTPYQMEYSLGIQQKMDPFTVLTISYVGNEGRNLFFQVEANPPVSQLCPCTDPFNPAAATLPAGQRYFPVPGAKGYVRFNKNFGALDYEPSAGTSHYHSLQTSLVRSMSHGVQFQVNYTWSKGTDLSSLTGANELINGSTQQENPYDRRLDYGPSSFDTRHVGTANVVYQLPRHGGGRLTNGWEASSLIQLRTGTPYNIVEGFDRANFNDGTEIERPNLVGNPNVGGPVAGNPNCNAPATVHNKAHWYNPCAVMVQPVGTFGDERRNQTVAPGFKNVDFALIKNTRIREGMSLQIRAELFNLFNHTNLGFPNLVALQGAPATPGNVPGSPFAGPVTLNQIVGYNPAAGTFHDTNGTSRQAQFAAKFLF